MAKLTKRIVDAASPREAAYFLWCSELSGFGVRVHPTGKRVYYADYRNKQGVRKRLAIGPHGKLTTEEARKLALGILGGVIRGEEPAERGSRMTVAELCSNYMAVSEQGAPFGKRRQPKKPSTLRQDQARIQRHILPLLGAKLVCELTRADISKFIMDVTTGKTALVEKTGLRGKAIVRGGAGTATRVVNFLSAVMTYAVNEGVVEYNVVRGVPRQADRKRTRRLSPDEFKRLGAALRDAENQGAPWQMVIGIRLLALTGCRLGEIINLRWSEIDLSNQSLCLQDTKEGPSIRPIGQQVLELCSKAQLHGFHMPSQQTNRPFVLPGEHSRSGSYGGMRKALRKFMKQADLEGVTAHTLRHSFASAAADLGYADATIASLLGHAGATVTSRYLHPMDRVLVAAADRVTERINDWLS